MRAAVEVEAGAPAPLVRLEGLARTYRDGEVAVPALRGVDLTLAPGEIVALTGPSGSGKSTLLHLVGLLDAPDGGRYALAGEDVAGLGPRAQALLRRRRLGFVFQGFNLVPVLTAAENVELPLLIAGVGARARRRRAAAALAAVGLADLAGRRPDALSGGQKQRVAIARALVNDPALVLADEPTANLDGATAGQVIDLMHALAAARGVTFLVATHDARMAARCDRVVALADGVLR